MMPETAFYGHVFNSDNTFEPKHIAAVGREHNRTARSIWTFVVGPVY